MMEFQRQRTNPFGPPRTQVVPESPCSEHSAPPIAAPPEPDPSEPEAPADEPEELCRRSESPDSVGSQRSEIYDMRKNSAPEVKIVHCRRSSGAPSEGGESIGAASMTPSECGLRSTDLGLRSTDCSFLPAKTLENWRSLCMDGGLEAHLRKRQGLPEDLIKSTTLDAEDGVSAPIALVNARAGTFIFATRSFEALVGRGRGHCLPILSQGYLDCLRPANPVLDQLVNANNWEKLEELRLAPGTPDPDKSYVVDLMLCESVEGRLFWNLVHAFRKVIPKKRIHCLVVVSTPLSTPVPDIFVRCTEGRSDIDFGSFAVSMSLDFLTQARDTIEPNAPDPDASDDEMMGQEMVTVIAQRVERCTKRLADTLSGAFEGDHFVPAVGLETVQAFKERLDMEAVFGSIEQDLKTAWDSTDDVYRNITRKGEGAIACAVVDPSVIDCPLVYISPGFEELTQYPRSWALGRNCRFLQPNERSKNEDYNGDEVRRMKKFCVHQTEGQILNFLFNEAADGTHFWNFLFMLHLTCGAGGRGDGSGARHYIFGVQTNIVEHKELLDTFILNEWVCGRGKANLADLRRGFAQEELAYDSTTTSLKHLADKVISAWTLEVGKNTSHFWEGANYVPVVGQPAVKEFAGQWHSLIEECSYGMCALFKMNDAVLASVKNNDENCIACAVSDPTAVDCPLVYLSKGFETITGYRLDFALGRNCRFLQPNIGDINQKINSKELARMREFCLDYKGAKGKRIVNFILNERISGERFWNLLHMEHVVVKRRPYILGVQTVLALPMPAVLRDRETSEAIWTFDPGGLNKFIDDLCTFLDQFRDQLCAQNISSMVDAAKDASDSIMAFMKRTCDDFEGDHNVPKLGREQVDSFDRDRAWKQMLNTVQTLFVKMWGLSEYNEADVACAVSDPLGTDCPLVYVSRKFETLTGYSREWVLGRNCRFLQPNDNTKNVHFNEEEKLKMRDFCSQEHPVGTRIINLMVNETKFGTPFLNLCLLEHLNIGGRPYIFAVQTDIDSEHHRITEMFVMDRYGSTELSRLRRLLDSKLSSVGATALDQFAREVVKEWAYDFPSQILELPLFKISGAHAHAEAAASVASVALANLVITPAQSFPEIFQEGLEKGVRHFFLALTQEDKNLDADSVTHIGHLWSLQVAQHLDRMRTERLLYLSSNTSFSLITRPHYIQSFDHMSKALKHCGHTFMCWLLDVRGILPGKPLSNAFEHTLDESLRTMAAKLRAGDVKAIGLYGPTCGIMAAMESLKRRHSHVPVTLLAVDEYPTKVQDQSNLGLFLKHCSQRYGNPQLLTYGLFGPHNFLLESDFLLELASSMNTDVCTLLLKWAKTQGYAVLMPTIKDASPAKTPARHCDSHFTHRQLTLNYTRGPSARNCEAKLKKRIDEVLAGDALTYRAPERQSGTSGTMLLGDVFELCRPSTRARALTPSLPAIGHGLHGCIIADGCGVGSTSTPRRRSSLKDALGMPFAEFITQYRSSRGSTKEAPMHKTYSGRDSAVHRTPSGRETPPQRAPHPDGRDDAPPRAGGSRAPSKAKPTASPEPHWEKDGADSPADGRQGSKYKPPPWPEVQPPDEERLDHAVSRQPSKLASQATPPEHPPGEAARPNRHASRTSSYQNEGSRQGSKQRRVISPDEELMMTHRGTTDRERARLGSKQRPVFSPELPPAELVGQHGKGAERGGPRVPSKHRPVHSPESHDEEPWPHNKSPKQHKTDEEPPMTHRASSKVQHEEPMTHRSSKQHQAAEEPMTHRPSSRQHHHKATLVPLHERGHRRPITPYAAW